MSGPGGGSNGGRRLVPHKKRRYINLANPQEAEAALNGLSEMVRKLQDENAALTAQRTSALKVIAWLVEDYGHFDDGVGTLVVSHLNASAKSNEHVLLHGEPIYEDDCGTASGQEITITTRMATAAERAAASTSTQRAGAEQAEQSEPSRIITPAGFDFGGFGGPGRKPH